MSGGVWGGVWLDRGPYVPPLVACVKCGDPLGPFEVMVTYVDGFPITPLCNCCYDRLCGEQ